MNTIRPSEFIGKVIFIGKFFGGMIALFALSYLVGRILRINEHITQLYNRKPK